MLYDSSLNVGLRETTLIQVNLPEHWKTEKLGRLCRIFSGYGFKTKDYTRKVVPLIPIGCLQDGEVVINSDDAYYAE